MKRSVFWAVLILFLFSAGSALAHQPRIVFTQKGDVQIKNPELSQAFYDELKDQSRDYFLSSDKSFDLYINLLVPAHENPNGRYTANVFSIEGDKENLVLSTDALSTGWSQYYEEFGRDYYLKGPEIDKTVPAGKYKIEVSSVDNLGKYVLAVGKKESFDAQSLLNVYWQLPYLKLVFFKTSVWQFFLTPFGIGLIAIIGVLLVLLAIIYYIIGAIKEFIKHNQAKTLLLASDFSEMRDEIKKLLQKPAYDVTVAFITTASKPEENLDYLRKDLQIMRDEMGFNVEEIDIEGKKEGEVFDLLKLKDIIFVEGGNTFYLLKAMRACNFERVIRKLLKDGKVYIGVSAGSIVAGKTIKTAEGFDENNVGLKNLKGLNLVPFDIFVHYTPENDEIVKQKMPNPKKRAKKLKIITDQQAILVQGKEVDLIGDGEAVVI